MPMNDVMTADELVALADAVGGGSGCPKCAALICKGWESIPGGYDRANLRLLGSLRDRHDEDPTVAEYHPAGTHGWSPDAPIALGWFPYNRCEVWTCAGCRRPFLRYTEFGGYYTDERIRELQADLVARSAS